MVLIVLFAVLFVKFINANKFKTPSANSTQVSPPLDLFFFQFMWFMNKEC